MSENSPPGDASSPLPPDSHMNIEMATAHIPHEMRNAEEVHNALLKEAYARHEAVRRNAERVLATHLLEEQVKELKLQADKVEKINKLKTQALEEKARVMLSEAQRHEAELKLSEAAIKAKEAEMKVRETQIKAREAENAVKLKQVPPRVKTPPPAPKVAPANQFAPTAKQLATQPSTGQSSTSKPTTASQTPVATSNALPTQSQSTQAKPAVTQPAAQSTPQNQAQKAAQPSYAQGTPAQPTPPPTSQNTPAPNAQPAQPNPPASGPQSAPTQYTSSQDNGQVSSSATAPATPYQPSTGFTGMVDLPNTQRYISIHLELKMLRNKVKDPKSPLKAEAGTQARALRTALGQLSLAGKNQNTFTKIANIFRAALLYKVYLGEGLQVLMVDPSPFVMEVPPPLTDPQAKNNGNQLPALFVYLLSIFAKALIAQAVTESSAKPETADPIALAAHQIFSHADFKWRGMPLIDILVAKLRKSCGCLFGLKGHEAQEEGRMTLGWKKVDGMYIPEQEHYNRMTGIGAFYAALCLRQYKNRINPYPPHHYWRSMASILTVPQEERSNTCYYVLAAMIQHFELKFLHFYGDMARSALEAALIEFPKGAREKNSAVMALMTLGEKIQRDGLHLPDGGLSS